MPSALKAFWGWLNRVLEIGGTDVGSPELFLHFRVREGLRIAGFL